MKPYLYFVIGWLFVWSTQAQPQAESERFRNKTTSARISPIDNLTRQYAYKKGQTAIEIAFDPQKIFASQDGPFLSLIKNTFKYRKFKKYGKATRLGIRTNFIMKDEILQQEDEESNQKELHGKFTAYDFMLMPGFEKHYKAGKNVSPYTGIIFLIGYSGNREITEYETDGTIKTLTLVNMSDEYPAEIKGGMGFVSGVDYFFTKNIYLGVEAGIGAQYAKGQTGKILFEDENIAPKIYKSGYRIRLAPALTTASFRLGWVF